jgi:hypothetical protein
VANGHNSFFILIFGPCSLAAQLADVNKHCVARIALSRADANHIFSLIFSLKSGILEKGFRFLPSVVVIGASFDSVVSAVSGHMFLLVALSVLHDLQITASSDLVLKNSNAIDISVSQSPSPLFIHYHRRVCLMSH